MKKELETVIELFERAKYSQLAVLLKSIINRESIYYSIKRTNEIGQRSHSPFEGVVSYERRLLLMAFIDCHFYSDSLGVSASMYVILPQAGSKSNRVGIRGLWG